jgi:hypothetical protein
MEMDEADVVKALALMENQVIVLHKEMEKQKHILTNGLQELLEERAEITRHLMNLESDNEKQIKIMKQLTSVNKTPQNHTKHFIVAFLICFVGILIIIF